MLLRKYSVGLITNINFGFIIDMRLYSNFMIGLFSRLSKFKFGSCGFLKAASVEFCCDLEQLIILKSRLANFNCVRGSLSKVQGTKGIRQ